MSPIGLTLIYYLNNLSNLSSAPVRIFCFVIHIISGISSRVRGHFYFSDNSPLGLVTRLRTGIPRSSLKRLQLLYLLSYARLSYPLSAASVPSKRCTLVFQGLAKRKSVIKHSPHASLFPIKMVCLRTGYAPA